MGIISSTCVDETSVTGFMHTSLSTLVGTGLAVVGPAEVTPWALLTQATKRADEGGA